LAYRETSKVRARKLAQRDALLQSAEGLVREGGFEALTMQALAERCGLAVGTVYRYFDSKDGLVCAVFERATEREIAAVRVALEQQPLADAALSAGLQVFARRALAAPRLAWALIAEPVAPALDGIRLRYRERWSSLFATVLERGVSSGLWPAQNTALAAAAMVGALAEALVGPVSRARQAPLHDAALVDDLVLFCLRATGMALAPDDRGGLHEQQA
jgi:AcrR family transcriptional regulator